MNEIEKLFDAVEKEIGKCKTPSTPHAPKWLTDAWKAEEEGHNVLVPLNAAARRNLKESRKERSKKNGK